ncbi:hypothetical protein [Uliginosibacterium sp. H1]|uniref:hypothetical protein n=1 Tax=Uliginosibacterium sp. H1 TaxID=3114757 RepID=UPI002E19FBFA|nr:hypothetical protein [Uliginosibacterium sp. H1]
MLRYVVMLLVGLAIVSPLWAGIVVGVMAAVALFIVVRRHIFKGPSFEYDGVSSVPILALGRNGKPYTGKAHGAHGSADWGGFFQDGRPHGRFSIMWGGQRGEYWVFEHGTRVRVDKD